MPESRPPSVTPSSSSSLSVNNDGDNSEHWRRTQHRAPLDTVMDILATPNLPDEHGNLLCSYDPIVATADRVGRVLRELDDAELTRLIRDDIADEVAAVVRAELGDLAGRAAQAVAQSRAEGSPAQVAAAQDALVRNPLGDTDLVRGFEPAAAAVAAAHWLYTAATLTAEKCGYDDLADLIRDADDIEALPVRVPMVVANRMSEGQSAADGHLADPDRLVAQIDDAPSEAGRFARRVDQIRASLLGDIRVRLLDPPCSGPRQGSVTGFDVGPGHAGDSPVLPLLLGELRVPRRGRGRPRTRPDVLRADRTFCSRGHRALLRSRGIKAVIPEKIDQAAHRKRRGRAGGRPVTHDAADYRNRNVVERFFNRMKDWRALASRYDKYAVVYRGGIILAAIVDWLKHLRDKA